MGIPRSLQAKKPKEVNSINYHLQRLATKK